MKTQKRSYTIFVLLALAAMLLWACKLSWPFSSQPTNQGGSTVLADPTVGLDTLQSYHVSFRQDVTGSLDGQPFETHTHIEMSRAPGQMDFTRELGGTEDPTSYFHAITDGQAVYRWYTAEQSCQGEAGELADGETLEPAALLFHLSGATNKGTELVNQVPATHYQFDQNDLRVSDPKPEVNGELWIADQGGYVVKLALTIAPPSKPTGAGIEAGQDWTYEISQVNAIDSIGLPADCMPVPLEIPALPDAQEITRSSGLLSFITASRASEVVDFYFQNLPPLGWETNQKKPDGDLILPVSLSFAKGDQKLSVNIDNSAQAGLDVDLLIYMVGAVPSAATATPGAALPTIPAATVNPAESGLPDDIPLYPGTTGMVKMAGMLKVDSSDPVDSVVNFYLEQMPALGWGLMQNIPSGDTTVLMWQKQKQDRIVSITVTSANGKTLLMIVQPNQ